MKVCKCKSVARWLWRGKADWIGCCYVTVQGAMWLAQHYSINLNFSFLDRILLLFIWSSYLTHSVPGTRVRVQYCRPNVCSEKVYFKHLKCNKRTKNGCLWPRFREKCIDMPSTNVRKNYILVFYYWQEKQFAAAWWKQLWSFMVLSMLRLCQTMCLTIWLIYSCESL